MAKIVSFRADDALYHALSRLARERGEPVSQLARTLLRHALGAPLDAVALAEAKAHAMGEIRRRLAAPIEDRPTRGRR